MLEAVDRQVLLWGVEQSLMKPDGRRREYEVARKAEDPLSITFQDYDWADEVLHAQFGRKRLLPEFESLEALRARYEGVNKRYRAIIERDQALPRAAWWDEFYRGVPREEAREAPA